MDELSLLIQTLSNSTNAERWQAARKLPEFGKDAEVAVVNLLLNATEPGHADFFLHVLSNFRLLNSRTVDAIVQRLSQEKTRCAAACCLLQTSPKLRRHLTLIRAIYEKDSNEGHRKVLKKTT